MMPPSEQTNAEIHLLPSRLTAFTFALLFASAIAVSLQAAPGVVQTRAGRVLEGDVRLDPGAGLAIAGPQGGGIVLVPFADLQAMKLGAGATAKSFTTTTAAVQADAKLEPLASPWQQAAVGGGRIAGAAGRLGEATILRAGGTNIWAGGRDQGHFVCQKLTGNGSLVARLDRTDARFAGLMMRKAIAPEAEFVLMASEGAGGNGGLTYLTRRSPEFRDKYKTQGDRQHRDGLRAPIWLRLDREGKKFTAHLSRDEGAHWELFATSHGRQSDEIFAGLFVCGGDANTAREAAFSKVTLDGGSKDSKGSRDPQPGQGASAAGQRAISSFEPHVVLRNSTVLVGKVLQLDPSGVRQSVLGQEQFFSSVQVARVVFRPVPLQATALLQPDRPGVLLTSGDFLEGEITSVKNNNLLISSVLLGQRQVDLGNKVIAVVWNVEQPAPGCLQLRLRDGGLLRARSLTTDGQALLAREAAPTPLRVPLNAVAEIQRD